MLYILLFSQFRYNTTTTCDLTPTPPVVPPTGEPDGPVYCHDAEVDYSNWNTDEPNNSEGKEHCVHLYSYNGAWNDNQCSHRYRYLCKKG